MFAKSISEIRDEYPHPSRKADDSGANDRYCVGGAVCMAHGLWQDDAATETNFPNEDTLCTALQDLNRGIDSTTAYNLAVEIIDANDSGEFDRAWELAEYALSVS